MASILCFYWIVECADEWDSVSIYTFLVALHGLFFPSMFSLLLCVCSTYFNLIILSYYYPLEACIFANERQKGKRMNLNETGGREESGQIEQKPSSGYII